MRIRRYIRGIGLLLSLWGGVVNAQEYQSVVCAGDTGIAYYVEGSEHSTFDWTVEGGVITRHYGDSIIVNWPSVPGEYNITVLETNVYGCVGTMQRALVLVTGPDIDLGGDTYVCSGETFEIIPEGEFTSYLWHDGSAGPGYVTDQEGWIGLEVTDEYGCAISDSLYLSILDVPEVNLGNDTSLCGDQSLKLDAGPDGSIYTWSTGEISQQIEVFQNGDQEIWVEVEDEFGCSNGDTVVIEACNVKFYFRDIPNAITANDDGVNDVWNLEKLSGYSQAVVEIFDQWGTLVWRSEPGYPDPWDGTNMNGQLVPVDSYHFVFDLNDGSNERFIGYVTVIR
jgi:gliding motility-associated-like protein